MSLKQLELGGIYSFNSEIPNHSMGMMLILQETDRHIDNGEVIEYRYRAYRFEQDKHETVAIRKMNEKYWTRLA